jgi:hypothetical protein
MKILPNSFTRYSLTSEELQRGQILTPENSYVIQNLISDIAEEKLSLKYDPQNPIDFAQREAELQGQLGILKMLLELSYSAQFPSQPSFQE